LAIINLGKIAGFSLVEIKSMFTGSELAIDRQMLLEKAQQLDANIKRLQVVSRGLKHVAQCPAPSHRECDKFSRIVRSASRIKTPQCVS
jgi:DNA-binding transcriptional MerR regulator